LASPRDSGNFEFDGRDHLATASTSITLLLGDVTADGVVDQTDVHEVQIHKGEPVDETNFRDDVNVDGQFDATDVRLVKKSVGTMLP
jgi:Dockerin type I domain